MSTLMVCAILGGLDSMGTDDAKSVVLARTEFDRLASRMRGGLSMSGGNDFCFLSFLFSWLWATNSA